MTAQVLPHRRRIKLLCICFAALGLAACATPSTPETKETAVPKKASTIHPPAVSKNSQEVEISAAEPSSSNPVTCSMQTVPGTVRAGDVVVILVRVRIAGAHHIYAKADPSKPFTPTTLKLTLPPEIEPLGEWEAPQPVETKTGDLVYTDSVQFRRRLKVSASAPASSISLEGELSCQACTEELCWPVIHLPLLTSLKIRPRTPAVP